MPAKPKYLRAIIAFGLWFLFLDSGSPAADHADAGVWRQHRDAARAAANVRYDEALRQYELAVAEAEKFSGNDMRFLNTMYEAGKFLVRLRMYDLHLYEILAKAATPQPP